jgi:serine/threonine protein kinase
MLNMIPLPAGSLLNGGLYQIERVVNIDGLCITYLASQTAFGDEVLLKEYCYPEEGDGRLVHPSQRVGSRLDELWANIFMEQIVLEAHQEHQLTGIVKPFEYFHEKNNEYLALENVIGEPLDRYLRRLPNGRMNPAEAALLIRQVAQTLDCLYNKREGFVPLYVLFRFNIKPSNILRRSADGEPVLLHFGSDPPCDGYAAPEQFAPFGDQTAATHVYALGAVFYRMLTGCDPPDCRSRAKVPLLPAEQLNGNVPEDLSRIASRAMELDPKKRFANVGELANALVMG